MTIEEKVQENGISNIASALCKAQGVMEGAKKDKKNPFFNSTYSDLSSVFEALRIPFANNGLSVCQMMDVIDSGVTILITRLMHVSGEFLDSRMILPIDPNPQRVGSCITYYKRYALMSIAGIASEDDDGNAAAGKAVKPKRLALEQISAVEKLINGHQDIREEVLRACKGDLGSITEDRYQNALDWINKMILDKSVENMPKVKKVEEKK